MIYGVDTTHARYKAVKTRETKPEIAWSVNPMVDISPNFGNRLPPKTRRYFLSGIAGTPRQSEFTYNYWDYAYRGLISLILTAKVLGNAEIMEKGYKYLEYFETVTGDTGSGDAEKLMKKMKQKKPNQASQ